MMGHIYIIPIPRTLENTSTWHECKVIRAGITGQKAGRPWTKAVIMISVKSTLNPD